MSKVYVRYFPYAYSIHEAIELQKDILTSELITFTNINESVLLHHHHCDENFQNVFNRVYFNKNSRAWDTLRNNDVLRSQLRQVNWSLSVAESHQHYEVLPERAEHEKDTGNKFLKVI